MIKRKIRDVIYFLLGSAILPLVASGEVCIKDDDTCFVGAFSFIFLVVYVLFFFIKKKVFVDEKWWKVFLWFLWFYFSICGLFVVFA